MKETYTTLWKGKMAFETEISGHKFLMDANESVGGEDNGPRPKPLLIAALTGCTGMDVASILKKMQVEVEDFRILTESEMTEEHPKTYTKIHLIYQFKGKDLPIKKLEKAVSLSQERYCGVSALLEKALELDYEIKIIE
ncbi:OsmC family protein [Helicovermis profundi]|uniref:OsmC family protein n=1 Tax=Helicovermis profundi TaxID=3065157 RepID=A0AAU9ED91_9FIRM|nr:OsmC family protein [Clostridia bacterium S502]